VTYMLWKPVENPGPLLAEFAIAGGAAAVEIAAPEGTQRIAKVLACSGCTGDYEDPDDTAWAEDCVEEDESEPCAPAEEFPARCN
jgi:hypothetical protein